MSLILADLEVLSPEECTQVRTEVFQQRAWWIPRKPLVPFYTLGAASYIDAAGRGSSLYLQLASSNNPVLASSFSWLHQRTCERLQEMLGVPVDLHNRLALPGFHIFLAHESFAQEEAASAHWDLQFQQIDWLPEEMPDFAEPLSFTMAISLPAAGAGLHLWELNQRDASRLTERAREERKRQLTRTFHPYEIGRMVVHSGLYLHQIAPMIGALPGEERITYQGHAIHCNGRYRLYW